MASNMKKVLHIPEQNGAVERENRTVVEAARTMLHAKDLSLNLWAEAVHTVVYVLNRTGTTSKQDKVPYELWFGKAPAKLIIESSAREYTHIFRSTKGRNGARKPRKESS